MNIIETITKIVCDNYCWKENNYLAERIQTLSTSLSRSVEPVDINAEKTQKVNPIKIINSINDIVIADSNYLAIDYDSWVKNLGSIYHELRNKLKYTPNIFDCDDFALIMASTVAYSAFKSMYKIQLAFGIAWSDVHAYNVFVCNNGRTYIYEPQNNTVVGPLGSDLAKMYKTKKIWFMG